MNKASMANPKALQAYVGIGGTTLKNAVYSSIVPRSTLIGFRHTRNAGDLGNQFSGKFIDHSAFELENALIGLGSDLSKRTMMFQYGYDMTTSGMSRVHYGLIYDYAPTIIGDIVELEILSVGRADVAGDGNNQMFDWSSSYNAELEKKNNSTLRPPSGYTPPEPYSLGSVTGVNHTARRQANVSVSPSAIVTAICLKRGWRVGRIEPTKAIKSPLLSGINMNQLVNPLEFINNTLIPLSESTSGVSSYKFWTETQSDGSVLAHYMPMQTSNTPSQTYSHNVAVNNHSISSESLGTIYGNHRDSVILDWSPVVTGGYLMAIGGIGVGLSTIDEATNEDYYTEATSKTSNLPQDGQRQWLPTSGDYASLKFSSSTRDGADRRVSSQWQSVMNGQYVVNCSMVGDPTRSVMETLDFNIYAGGRLHHTSGRYLVTGIEDDFSIAGYRTNLELLKNSAYAGPSASGSGSNNKDTRGLTDSSPSVPSRGTPTFEKQ